MTAKPMPNVMLLAALLASLSACDRHSPPRRRADMMAARIAVQAPALAKEAAATAAPWFTPAPRQGAGLNLAYSHEVGLEVAGGAIAAHFNAARDRCLNDLSLHCTLLYAEFSAQPAGGNAPPQRSGSLRVRLPHDQVATFANGLTAALPGEAPGLARVVRQVTSAEDLGRPIADVGQRMAQLQDYLASLKALGSRLTISVSDLVKIASETAQAQTQIEAAQAEQRDLSQRVATEALDVSFQEQIATPPRADPVDEVWKNSAETFRANLAEAVQFGIAAAPWVPVFGVGALVLLVLRRMLVGRLRK